MANRNNVSRRLARGSLHRPVRPFRTRYEEQDTGDHEVGENVRYRRSKHTVGASTNESHEQAVDTSEKNAEPAARKPSHMNRADGQGRGV